MEDPLTREQKKKTAIKSKAPRDAPSLIEETKTPVMAAYQSSLQRFGRFYKKLAE